MVTTESLAEATDVVQILRQWEDEHTASTYDPIPTLQRLAEIIEVETENYLKMDPDPFDERHPSRTDPECNFGHILKVLFKKDNFMTKLINDYLRDTYYSRNGITGRDVRKLNIAACRLMLDILPGLETSAVFQPDNDSLIHRLFSWAEKSVEPLQSYATGLLAAAMEVQDIATSFREQNGKLVPLMLQRLHKLQEKAQEDRQAAAANSRPFAHFGGSNVANNFNDTENTGMYGKRKGGRDKKRNGNGIVKSPSMLFYSDEEEIQSSEEMPPNKKIKGDKDQQLLTPLKANTDQYSGLMSPPGLIPAPRTPNNVNNSYNNLQQMTPPTKTTGAVNLGISLNCKSNVVRNLSQSASNTPTTLLEGNSNSSWAELESYVIGNIQIHPPTLATRQMLILRYLTPMGEYQEFLGHVFEQKALVLIFKYINVRETKDSRLAFEALKYLASLLCHKKFSIEFLNMGGLLKLLDVPRPSVAATGVSICLYYLAYCEDALERVCVHHSKVIIADLVTYALWLLERSHDSGRCHATMFFGCSFPFKVILEEFDAQDGLRKLFNVISTLPILNVEEEPTLNDDEECASRQIVRHVAVALKKYMEVHLYWKAEQLLRMENARTESDLSSSNGGCQPSLLLPHKPCKFKNEDEVQEKIEVLQKLMSIRAVWSPVEELYRLGAITLLLQIIAFAREWIYNNRAYTTSSAETVRSCLDVISICSVVPKVMMLLCDRINIPDSTITTAINLLLAAAEGEIVPDPDVQRAALRAIVNCVCAPINRVVGTVYRYSVTGSAKKKANNHKNEELIQKVWSCVRSNNGIMVLLQLMMVKAPITEADSIRALACRALAGLARSEKVRQIISKLPMFTDGQIQSLMKNPIHNEKRQEHVMFQKYALELMERVSGKAKPSGSEYEMSLASLHRANVIAQTRIQFDDQQLYQIICQHLMYKGLNKIAADLQKAVNLEYNNNNNSGSGGNTGSVGGGGGTLTSSCPLFTYNNPGTSSGIRAGFSPYNSRLPNSQRENFLSRGNIMQSPINQVAVASSARFISHSPGTFVTPTSVNNSLSRTKQQIQSDTPSVLNPCPPGSNFSSPSVNPTTMSPVTSNQPIKLQINHRKTSQTTVSTVPPGTPTTTITSPIALDNSNKNISISGSLVSCSLSPSDSNKISSFSSPCFMSRSLQKQISWDSGGAPPEISSVPGISTTTSSSSTSQLESIVTEYLTNQHSLCKNPMVTCPKFNLFMPHKCPDPRPKNSAAINVTSRVTRRTLGLDAIKLDRRYIYSRFCPIKTFRPTDVESTFTCCVFSPCQQYLMLGTYSGDVRMFNLHTGIEEITYQCHESYIYHIQCNKKGDLLLTSTVWRQPSSALWSIGQSFDMKLPIENEDYVEFSKLQDKIIGTQNETAKIYDVGTGKLLRTLKPSVSNQYIKNRATFSMNDELVLSDGILWDVNSGKEIHKFDKLNQTLNGVFHPNGTEVVSNTEVWDLRTFHLLNTVPSLDQMEVIFSPINHIIYAVSLDQESDDESTNVTSFKTLDALDYSNIATYDVKRGIYSLACNKYDTQIAIVENQGDFDSVQESCVRLYDVGRRRDDEDEADEDDDDEEDMDASDDDNSNSDSDDDNNDGVDNADGAGGDDNRDDDANLNDAEDDDDDDDEESLDGDESVNDSLDFDPNSPDQSLSDNDDFVIMFRA